MYFTLPRSHRFVTFHAAVGVSSWNNPPHHIKTLNQPECFFLALHSNGYRSLTLSGLHLLHPGDNGSIVYKVQQDTLRQRRRAPQTVGLRVHHHVTKAANVLGISFHQLEAKFTEGITGCGMTLQERHTFLLWLRVVTSFHGVKHCDSSSGVVLWTVAICSGQPPPITMWPTSVRSCLPCDSGGAILPDTTLTMRSGRRIEKGLFNGWETGWAKWSSREKGRALLWLPHKTYPRCFANCWALFCRTIQCQSSI